MSIMVLVLLEGAAHPPFSRTLVDGLARESTLLAENPVLARIGYRAPTAP
jgi:hypothetical protein